MLIDPKQRAPVELYRPYALINNALVELWLAAELEHGIPSLYDHEQGLSKEHQALACNRLSELLGKVSENLTAAQEPLALALEWFGLGASALPTPRFKYPSLFISCMTLQASTCHELAYEIAEGLVLDLSVKTGDTFSGIKNRSISRLQDREFMSEALANLAQEGLRWPLLSCYWKRHQRLLNQLRQEFLRTWAQSPYDNSSQTTFHGDLNLHSPSKETNCTRRNEFFIQQSIEGRNPAQSRKTWNEDAGLRARISPDARGLVSLSAVQQVIKLYRRRVKAAKNPTSVPSND